MDQTMELLRYGGVIPDEEFGPRHTARCVYCDHLLSAREQRTLIRQQMKVPGAEIVGYRWTCGGCANDGVARLIVRQQLRMKR